MTMTADQVSEQEMTEAEAVEASVEVLAAAVEVFDAVELAKPPAVPPSGGAGSPELAKMTPDGRVYHDPLPWCAMLRALGILEADFVPFAEFPSVTTLLNYLPKDKLVKWSANQAALSAVEDHWVLDLFGPSIALSYWARAGERARDMAGARGTLGHDIAEDGESIVRKTAEALMSGRGVDERFLVDANVAAYVKGLQKFFAAHPGIRPIWTEVTVFSRRFGYAGTLDLIAYVPGVGVVLLDWKLARFVMAKFSFQMAAYRHADYGIADGVRVPIPPVEGALIVHIMPGDDNEGAFEVIPVDSSFELAEKIMPAMHDIKRLDHQSRVGKPLKPADLTATAPAAPKLKIVTPHEAAQAIAASDHDHLLELCRDPYDRLRDQKMVVRQWHIDYCRDRAAALQEAAATDPAVAARLQLLANWLAQRGLRFDDPSALDPDQHEDTFLELVDGLAAAEKASSLPFGPPKPQAFDWDDLLGQYLDETVEAAGMGLIEPDDDTSMTYHPVARPPRLDRNAVTLVRRGRSVDPDDWAKPRDPAAVARETELIGRVVALPEDLRLELERRARNACVPNLRLGVASDEQLDTLEGWVAELCDLHATRVQNLRHVFEVTVASDPLPMIDLLLQTVGALSFERCTEAQLAFTETLLAAVSSETIEAVPTVDGDLEWSVRTDEAAVVAKFGTKRNALAAGRTTAARFNLPTPGSTSGLIEMPVLLALTMHAPAEISAVSAA